MRVGENMSSFYGYRRLGVYTEEDFNNGLCEKNQIGRAKRTDKKEIMAKVCRTGLEAGSTTSLTKTSI